MGRRKNKSSRKHLLCNICCDSISSSKIPISCCSLYSNSSEHAICDQCFGRYIFTTISNDITAQVICPKQGCNAILKPITIETALLVCNHHDLWQEYLLKSNWRGTNAQWIKRFAVKCPVCRIPIEKNGGCNHMTCKLCHSSFNWEQAKKYGSLYRFRPQWNYLHKKMNPFGGSPFGGGGGGGGFPPQFPGAFPQQGFGQFGNGGFFNGGTPFPGGNAFPGSTPFPPQGFLPPPGPGSQFGQGFGFPSGPGGFGYSQTPFGSQFAPGQQPPYGNPYYFGGGGYGRPRSRHGSRHRSHSRHRRETTSSSSDDDHHRRRGSPYGAGGGFGNPYPNVPPYSNMPPVSPHGGSPAIPPRRPVW